MNAPLVSVILPCFNRLRFLEPAVASVCAQTFRDFEFLIIDDGSEAQTRTWLVTRVDPRMRVILHAHTGNQSMLRNLAIAGSRGRYLAFMDSDDLWVPEKLERQLELLQSQPTRRWTYCNSAMIDAQGRRLPPENFARWQALDGIITEPLLSFDASVSTAAVVLERSLFEQAGRFDERLRFCQSHELWCRISLLSEVSVSAEPLLLVRTHPECFTADRVGAAEGWLIMFDKLAGYLESPRLRSLSRRRYRESALALARLYARQGGWGKALATLARAQRLGVAAPAWWLRAFAMLGRALLAPA